MSLVFTTHPLHPDAAAMLQGIGDLVVADSLNQATLERQARQADAIIVRAPISEALVASAPQLKAVVRHGAGVDMIPVETCTSLGVLVANVPAANARAVAEHALMTSLMLLRRFRPVDIQTRDGKWAAARATAEPGAELSEITVGLVGYGSVGQAAAAIFGPLVRRIRAYSPSGRAPAAMTSDLDGIFTESDIAVLCCPLTEETRGLVGARRLGQMKNTAMLVNVGRGGLIDDDALLDALRTQRIQGAALDVFSQQPLPPDHPYFSLSNVVVTPHIAGLTQNSMKAMGVGAVREVIRVLSGRLPVNIVNPQVVPRYLERFPGTAA